MLYIWRLFVRSEGIRKDGMHSFKDACGQVATQIGFSMGPVADVKVVRREDRLSLRYTNRANGLRAWRLLNGAQCSDGNPRPGERDSAVDCQVLPLARKRVNLDRGKSLGGSWSYAEARRAFCASSASRFRYDSPSMVRISA
jgi:hypothetical protein